MVQSAVIHNPEEKELIIFALNCDFSQSWALDINLEAFGRTRVREHSVLRSDDLYAKNTYDQPERVKPEALAHNGSVELPPLSWSRIIIAIE